MSTTDPVTDLDNAIATAYLLAEQQIGELPVINGRHELRRTLGRGAYGLVCAGFDRHLRRPVALKLVPLRDARSADNAVREAQTLARFDHPNIVRIHDVGQTTSVSGLEIAVVYVVMELLEGVNLRHWANDRPDARAVLEVFLAAGEGLAAAHEQQIVHGDFKPENVVIDARGRVRVVDFGLARWGDEETLHTATFVAARTLTQGPRGTPGYIAPEVYSTRGDARSDQYSFAVSLWELLLGRLPFDHPHQDSAPDLERSARSLSTPLAAALQRGFARDPAARFASMRELLAALRDASLATLAPVMPPRAGRWRMPLAGSLLAGAALLGGLAFMQEGEAPAPGPVSGPAVEPRPTPVCPEVAEIAGTWDYTSSVMWAADARFLGERGYYRVTVTPELGCRAAFHVVKHGDSSKPKYGENLEDRLLADVTRTPDGAVEVTLALQLAKPSQASAGGQRSGLHYRQTLSWTAGDLRGDWTFVQAKTRAPEMRGLLVGARAGQPHEQSFTLADATCPGQCRVRCAGDAAAQRCISEHCRGASGTVADCGGADEDFEPPSKVLQAASEPLGASRGVTDRCRQVAQRLPGEWRVWKRGRSGGARAERFELRLESVGCELTGRVKPPSGHVQELDGWVDPNTGVWRLQPRERPELPVWALAGWDPAFGAADRGEATLVAHRTGAR